eukprot:TRINITY_DN1305_c0_g1_i9.p1 TRINITY_DN1305_c0_g1~~TRINITY_DN1305_c0_g1_i9.p1  ORF type:complete len:491 (-),score=100.28 TRINITY_DN1305_c0_g1_i9:1423-2895(-)
MKNSNSNSNFNLNNQNGNNVANVGGGNTTINVDEIKRLTLRATPNSPIVNARNSGSSNANDGKERKQSSSVSSGNKTTIQHQQSSPALITGNHTFVIPPLRKTSPPVASKASTITIPIGEKEGTGVPKLNKPNSSETKPPEARQTLQKTQTSPNLPTEKKLTELEYRQKIIQEILDTENAYVKHLNVLIEKYMKPLKEEGKFAKEPISDVFANVEDIYNINSIFLSRLKERIESSDAKEVILGDIFLQEGAHFKPHYIKYTELYQNAQHSLSTCEKSASFQTWTGQALEGAGETIRSLQIKPVQRITRYVLLLTDLIKRTPESHPDYSNLKSSLEKMTSTAQVVNEAIKAGENRQKILDIQSSFLGKMQLLEPHRLFIREGALSKVCRKSTKSRWFFLFNDLLIHASLTSINKYTSHQIWKLSDIRTEDFIHKDSSECAFQLVTTTKSFVVYAANKAEKIEWLKDINQASDELAKKMATFGQLQNESKIS